MTGPGGDITPRSAVVVGAGIVGLSTAWFLQDRGVHVSGRAGRGRCRSVLGERRLAVTGPGDAADFTARPGRGTARTRRSTGSAEHPDAPGSPPVGLPAALRGALPHPVLAASGAGLPALAHREPARLRHPGRRGRDGDTHHRVRTDKIDKSGTVTLRVAGRLRHIGVGRPHAGTHVLLLAHDHHVRVINAATGELLRELDIDTTATTSPDTHRARNDKRPNPHNVGSGVRDVLRHHTAPPAGFEPATPALGERCSIP